MNEYHVYQAIGHGKYSTVYKGRKKKNIPYLAIKSVDKSQKSKVLQEVRILHTLDHPNVLKFYSWYETSAHLWLVLEYCVGGDLMNLLRQDHQLPEDSIHDLACGIVRALLFLHSKGIIYCDLKPSNILLDENGQTKLCDFGLARKLVDISKTPFSSLPQAKRGTPFYMAPELFQEGGVHSYSSDLWALGCVLYECYAGRPPFFGKELTNLIRSILLDPVPTLPGSPSLPFVNLINSLLVKNPVERIQWPELCTHAFWGTKFASTSLPPQPAFRTMIENFHKMLTLHSSDAHQINTPPKHRGKDQKGASRQVENSAKRFNTPVKASECSQRTHAKVSSKITPDRPRDGSGLNKGVNVLRLSKIAKSNLQKENDKENYRRVLPTSVEIDVEVNVENTDMELDFNENMEEEVQDEAVEANHPACSSGKTSELDNSDQLDDSKESEVTTTVEPNEVSVASPLPCGSPQIKVRRDKDPTGYIHESDSSKLSNLSQLIWQRSDFSVRPIMPTRKADKVLETIPSLPFDALSASEFARLSEEQLHAFSSRIITIFNGNATASEKQNVMKYLEMVSCNTEAANMLTNGPVMLVLVKMLRQSKASALRVHAVSLIALLIRHSTFLTEDLANSGILRSLSDGLRDKQERMRRFSMAALGELLFYIATQEEQRKTNTHPESPSNENKPSSSAWQVSDSLISLVSSVLRKGEDDLTQFYALKTIENICSQGAVWAARFTTQDVIANLSYIFRAAGKQEIIRITAASCLARLVYFSPSSVQLVIEKLSFKDIASGFVKGSPREQQICLNLLNTALLRNQMFTNIGQYVAPLLEDKNLVMNLVSLIEQGNEMLRGKSLIFVGLLCKIGRRGLSQFFCSQKLLSAVDKLLKDKDQYVQDCLQGFIDIVASLVPGLLETVTSDIQQLMGGRKQGHIPVFSRTPARTHLHLLPVLHILGNLTLRRKAVDHQVLQQLANVFKLMESKSQGRDDFQITLLRILEFVVEDPSLIVKHADVVCVQISQSLTILYKGNKDGNARFLCLKILFDIVVILLNEPSEGHKGLHDSISACKDCFFALYPIMIGDEDPIPMYTQKLLLMLMEFGYIQITDILDQQTVSRCFDIILRDFSSANVGNLQLCLALASASELGTSVLSQLKVVRKIGNFLEFVNVKEMDDFIEPVLSLCRVFLLRSLGRTKDFVHLDESDLVFDGNSFSARKDIKDITALGCNIGVLIELSGSQKSSVADTASECVVLLLKAVPREASTGLLTSLPKMTAVLMSLSSPAILCRMLLSLDYACRQFVSQAMILSIPAQEIAKIEAIVLQLKTSDLHGVAEACLLVASCLQQLAPYI